MASLDYGAIAFKNGKMISTERWTPMIDMVGWKDNENDTYHDYNADKDKPLNLNGRYFVYIGDSDYTIAFYKGTMVMVHKYNDGDYALDYEHFDGTYYHWCKWENYDNIKVTKRNGYYVCKWKYKGDKYKVYFGYGVDFDYYKERHIVNYYRSFDNLVYDIRRKVERWFDNWRNNA